MKRFLGILALVVVFLAAAVIALPFLIPADMLREPLRQAVKDATGRELAIAGELEFTVIPELGVRAGGVTFSNAPGGRAEHLASVEDLVFGVQFWPLLSREIRVNRIILKSPVIALETDAQGRSNLDFGTGGGAGAAAPAETPGADAGGFALNEISFNEVRIENGIVSSFDARSGEETRLEDVDVAVTLPGLDQPLGLDGGLTFKGERFDIAATIAEPRAVLDGGRTPLTLNVASSLITMTLNGTSAAGFQGLAGALSFDTPSLRRLAGWAGGSEPAVAGGLGALSLTGQLAAEASGLKLSGLRLGLDGMTATGDLAVTTGGAVPRLTGTLDVDRLDLNTYLGTQPGSGGGGGTAAGGGWSSEPLALDGLKAANADLSLTVGGLSVQTLRFGRSVLKVVLQNGVLDANLREIALYEGGGSGRLRVDAAKATPAIANRLELKGVQAQRFLADLMGVDRIAGVSAVTFDVTGAGASQAAIMRSLNGSGNVVFTDGVLYGVNLAQIARQIQSALSGEAVGEAAKTDFAEMGASFQIADGIMATQDFRLLNPFVRLTGAGLIDLGAQAIDFRVEPRAVGTMQGQGGALDASGLGIPFRIKGPWSNLSFYPDFGGAAEDALKGAIGNILGGRSPGEGLLEGLPIPGAGGAGGNPLQGILPGGGGSGESSGAAPANPLDAILGGGRQQPQPAEGEGQQPQQRPENPLDAILGGGQQRQAPAPEPAPEPQAAPDPEPEPQAEPQPQPEPQRPALPFGLPGGADQEPEPDPAEGEEKKPEEEQRPRLPFGLPGGG